MRWIQLGAALFNFLVVAWAVWKWGGPPITRMLHTRNEANLKAIEDSEAAHAEASSRLAALRERLSNVDAELASMLDQARGMARQAAEGIAANAEADAARLKEHALAQIERDRLVAQQAIHQRLLAQALQQAREELRRAMTPDHQRLLVTRFIARVGDGSCAINP